MYDWMYPICIKCNNNKIIVAKKMCENCYKKQRRLSSPLIKCQCSEECQEMIYSIGNNGKPNKYAKGHYMKIFLKNNRHPNFKGGRFKTNYGYVMIWVDGKYFFEHRVVMGQMIGRKLRRNERVHHKNHIKDDNRPENLELFEDNRKHVSSRHRINMSNRVCIRCNNKNTSHDKNNRPIWAHHDNGFLCVKCNSLKKYYKKIGRPLPV